MTRKVRPDYSYILHILTSLSHSQASATQPAPSTSTHTIRSSLRSPLSFPIAPTQRIVSWRSLSRRPPPTIFPYPTAPRYPKTLHGRLANTLPVEAGNEPTLFPHCADATYRELVIAVTSLTSDHPIPPLPQSRCTKTLHRRLAITLTALISHIAHPDPSHCAETTYRRLVIAIQTPRGLLAPCWSLPSTKPSPHL